MKINVKTLVFFFLLLLAIYQDFPLVNVFGEIARSPIIFLTPLMLLYLLMLQKITISSYAKYFIYYILYLILITLLYLVIVFCINGSFLVLGENILIKSVKLLVYPISALIFYQFTYTYLSKGKNTFNSLFNAIFCIQIILAIYLFFEVIYLKTNTVFLSFLHSDSLKYYRVRLFTYEESWIGTILTFFVFTPIFLVNYLEKAKAIKQKVYIVSAFLFLFYTFFSESKGYLLLLIVAVLPITISYMFKDKKWNKIVFVAIPILMIGVAFVVFLLHKNISTQLHSSITFGTRLTSYLASLEVFISHPFGIGWGGFLYYYPEAIRDIINTSWMSTFNLEEIKGYLTATKALSTKTEFFDNLVYGGFVYLFFYYNFFVKRYLFFKKVNNSNVFFLQVPLLFCLLAGLIYITFYIKYEVWFLLAFLDVLQCRVGDKISKSDENINCF